MPTVTRDSVKETGTARAGTASTLTLSVVAVAVADALEGKTVSLVAGQASPQSRVITDYDPVTKIISVSPNWELKPSFLVDYTTGSAIPSIGGVAPVFTRATIATYFDADGVMRTAAAGEMRFTHDPVTLEPLGYLPEGARPNRCLRSQEFDNAAWVKTNVAVTANDAAAPDGTTTADLLTATAGNGTVINDLGVVASAAKAGGLWIKRKTGTGNIDLTLDGGAGWTTKAITAAWTRIQITQTLADEDFGIRIVTSGDEVWVWQGQVETAAFLSSDIFTTSAAVTRNADVLTYPTTGWFNAVEGTLVAEFPGGGPAPHIPVFANIDDGTANERITLFVSSSIGTASVVDGGVGQSSLNNGAIVAGSNRLVAAYKANDFAASMNGSAAATDTSGTLPTVTTLRVGYPDTTINAFSPVSRIAYYPKRLSNSQLQLLSASDGPFYVESDNFLAPDSTTEYEIEDVNLRRARIGYRNLFRDGAVTVSSEDADHPKELAYDGLTYDGWRTTGGPTQHIKVRLGPEENAWSAIAWSPELGLYAAVASSGTYRFATSSDGKNWIPRTAPEANTWTGICWSPEVGLFVAVASDGTSRVATSPDGINWTARTAGAANPWESVCWAAELGLFVAIASSGIARAMKSSDGITWSTNIITGAIAWKSVTWSPQLGLLVGVASGTSSVTRSSNGTSWSNTGGVASSDWRSVTWSRELGLLVAVASSGTTRVQTSADGTTWDARQAAEANAWYSVAWSPQLELLVAVSTDGTNRVMTSANGINWTAREAADAYEWRAVAWSPALGRFAAVSQTGTYPSMTSDDGTTWDSAVDTVDYMAIAAHTLAGCSLTPQYTQDGATWLGIALAYTPTDNSPIVWDFDAVEAREFRLLIENAPGPVSIGAIHVGEKLEMLRGFAPGWVPPSLNEAVEYTNTISQGGQILGRNIVRRGAAVQVTSGSIEYVWAREDWMDFVAVAELYAVFFWRAIEGKGEILYGGMTSKDADLTHRKHATTRFTLAGITR